MCSFSFDFLRVSFFFNGLDNPRNFITSLVLAIYKAKCIFYSNTILQHNFSCSALFFVETCENSLTLAQYL